MKHKEAVMYELSKHFNYKYKWDDNPIQTPHQKIRAPLPSNDWIPQ